MPPNGPRAHHHHHHHHPSSRNADGSGSRPQQALQAQQAPLPEGVVPRDHSDPPKGPDPGHVQVACQYTLEQKLRKMLKEYETEHSREDTYRIQGVQLIDNVRERLHLPVRTFDTACCYYHLFRLCHRNGEYNFQDAALASLFLACKVEDTIKKSKEILCTAYNIKSADHPLTQDDKMFEQPSKLIIGLERLILETIGFDFRSRYVQKYLVKAVRSIVGAQASKDFFAITYDMSIDLHQTFAPIKQTTWTMTLAIVELTSLITGRYVDEMKQVKASDWHTTRADVLDTMLDLLDLYTQHLKSTRVGPKYDINSFIDVKIDLNREVESSPEFQRFPPFCKECDTAPAPSGFTPSVTPSFTPGSSSLSVPSPNTPGTNKRGPRGWEGTSRFVFDMDKAQIERDAVRMYLHEDYEDVEVEITEPIPESERPPPRDRKPDGWHSHSHHSHGRNNRDRRKGPRYYNH